VCPAHNIKGEVQDDVTAFIGICITMAKIEFTTTWKEMNGKC
jgi:hypothetical protein